MSTASVVDLLPQPHRLLLSEVIGSFSYALDMAEGLTPGHSLRCCWLGSQIGKSLALDTDDLWDLYFVLLLKDIGGSSISSKLSHLFDCDEKIIKSKLKILDSHHIFEFLKFTFSNTSVNSEFVNRTAKLLPLILNGKYYLNEVFRSRAERGADLVIQLGFNDNVADGIHCLNEHWDGSGYADGIKDHVIPVSSQIALIAEVFDVFFQQSDIESALDEIKKRSNRWFNPELVSVLFDIFKITDNSNTWQSFRSESILKQQVYSLESVKTNVSIDDERLDDIATAFAQIVDSKSPYSNGHSTRVALYSDAIANELGLSVGRRRWLYRGALLHDIGNMGISNLLLDKQTELSISEKETIMTHSGNTFKLLQHIQSFKELAKVASAHHEQLDGKGYPKGLSESRITQETRIITVATIFDKLMKGNAHNQPLSLAKVLIIMEKQCDIMIDRDCFNAFKKRIPDLLQN